MGRSPGSRARQVTDRWSGICSASIFSWRRSRCLSARGWRIPR
ncbi:hypothetical protein [Pseudomonas cavernicola]